MLYFIYDTAPIVLMTDASDYGARTYLYELIDDKKEFVALVITSLTKTQLKWSVIQKIVYAIFNAPWSEFYDSSRPYQRHVHRKE